MVLAWIAMIRFPLKMLLLESGQYDGALLICVARLGTSRPKARDGHRYPCPALVFCNGSSYVSRAAAPEGTGGDEVL